MERYTPFKGTKAEEALLNKPSPDIESVGNVSKAPSKQEVNVPQESSPTNIYLNIDFIVISV
ncbi:hypothetical protein HMPREF9446_01419 [Bacteroides fluxus YIT 12057]|uniref:Uncharacterized protein n=1 Tax=Bacteroides fluxus YIT 12057 TaxID=763034 RepID=F3PRR6_9BACE|nr:hypothetical protein HMPREF9446_01419 [Bacteroides fluxus YIT 12057]